MNTGWRGWYATVNWTIIGCVLLLTALGFFVVIESSLSVSANRDLSLFYYIERHAVHIAAALSLMFLLSAVGSRAGIGILALGLLIAALIGMILALLIGPEINNARRWIQISSLSLQPSEFLKAGFIVVNAWLLRFFWEDRRCFSLKYRLARDHRPLTSRAEKF